MVLGLGLALIAPPLASLAQSASGSAEAPNTKPVVEPKGLKRLRDATGSPTLAISTVRIVPATVSLDPRIFYAGASVVAPGLGQIWQGRIGWGQAQFLGGLGLWGLVYSGKIAYEPIATPAMIALSVLTALSAADAWFLAPPPGTPVFVPDPAPAPASSSATASGSAAATPSADLKPRVQ